MNKDIEISYCPRDQFMPLHECKKRWMVVVAHRRSGKTVASLNQLIRGALLCPNKNPRFAYIAPYRIQAKAVAWQYLKDFTEGIPDRKVSESELYIQLPKGGRITLYGADNSESLRGLYLDGCVVDEPADMDGDFFKNILRPALSDRLGWCLWIGTPKGRNSFFTLFDNALHDDDYFTLFLPASQSKLLPQSELDSALKVMGKEAYDREYECSFEAPVPGSIYANQINHLRKENRILDFPMEQGHPLYTFWDLGQSDFTCIWLVQLVNRDILLLNYFSDTGRTPAYYVDQCLIWEKRYNKPIKMHHLPHDANTRDRGGKTWISDLKDAGMTDLCVVPRTPDIWLGINQVRDLMPRFVIHRTNCSKQFGTKLQPIPSGLDCLEYYRKREVQTGAATNERPVHDEFSHGADAIRTLGEAYSYGLLTGTSEFARQTKTVDIRVSREPVKNNVFRKVISSFR